MVHDDSPPGTPEEAARLFKEIVSDRQQWIDDYVASLSGKSAVEKAEAYLNICRREWPGYMGEFGDAEAVVYFISRGKPCQDEIKQIRKAWLRAEQDRYKFFPKHLQDRLSDVGIGGTHSSRLPDFWSSEMLGADKPFVDSTMLRTVEWAELEGFEVWWDRFAREAIVEIGEGYMDWETDTGSHFLLAMCRSGHAISLMRNGLSLLLNTLELSGPVSGEPWCRKQYADAPVRCGMEHAATIAFANCRLRSTPSAFAAGALDVLMSEQREDGGWPVWKGDEDDDLLTTLFATHALALARPAGWGKFAKKAAKRILSLQNEFGGWLVPGTAVPNSFFLTVLALDALELVEGSEATTLKGLPAPQPNRVFVPTPLQKAILAALDQRALKKEALAIACKVDPRMFYKPGGIKELRDRQLVKHRNGVGFYRPDAPPPDAISWVPN